MKSLKNRPKLDCIDLLPKTSREKELHDWFVGFEKKFANFDAQKWFEENVYEDWTWEGMLKKFIKKEILG